MRLLVYTASSVHLDAAFHDCAGAVGRLIVDRGWSLVYGGGGIGLMGTLARAVRAGGGHITGVITESLLAREQGYDGCDELLIVPTMQERKRRMLALCDGVLVLPGGLGTLDELFEAITLRLVGEHRRPIGIVNALGFFDPLLRFLDHAIAHRFVRPAVRDLLLISQDPAEVMHALDIAETDAPLDDARFLPMGRG